MQFKKLEIKQEGNLFTRLIQSPRLRKTSLAMLIGAAAGFGLFYLSKGMEMETIPSGDIFESLILGAFFGLFITNSPCARGRC